MMSFEDAAYTSPGDPPPQTSWGFSGRVVTFIRTREQAQATVRFFAYIRDTIVASPARAGAHPNDLHDVSPADSERWARGGFSSDEKVDVILRALKMIARDPAGRADTLLALDVHTAYLCGRFSLPEPA